MNYISKEFQIQYLPYYKLHVLSGHQQELLVVMDDEGKVQVVLQYPSDAPTSEATKLLALPFREVTVVLPQQNVTFIPKGIYREEDQSLYAEYLLNKNNLSIETVCLDGFEVCALFQYDSLLHNRWAALYPEAEFVPLFVPLFRQMETVTPGSKLFVHTDGNQAHFLLTVGGSFKFYNVFQAQIWEDIAYYTLKVTQNLGLTKVDEILLSVDTYSEKLKTFADKVVVWQCDRHGLDAGLSKVSGLNLVLDDRPCVS